MTSWTSADEKLLLQLDQTNPGLDRPALVRLFNAKSEHERKQDGISSKLSKLRRKERIKNRHTASAPNKGAHSTRKVTPEAVVGGGNEDDDSDGNVSESSTVPTTSEEDELEDEEEEEDQLSSTDNHNSDTSGSPYLRRTSSHATNPISTPFSLQAPPRHSPTKSTPSHTHRPQAGPSKRKLESDSDDEAETVVTEAQALETMRKLVKVTTELAEMEQRCLARQRRAEA